MPELPTQPDETLTYLFNPSKEDFTYPFAGINYTMPSRKIIQFPKYLADHLAKHLSSKLALTDDNKIHFEERQKKWLDKIMVRI
jgi:hypothetical protein